MNHGATLSEIQEKLVAEFQSPGPEYSGSEIRKKAIAAFQKMGFPTVKNEEWKYTNLEKFILSKTESAPATKAWTGMPDEIKAHKIIIRDGKFDENASEVIHEDKGIKISTLAHAWEHHAELMAAHFGKSLAEDTNGLVALNTAFATEGVFILIEKGIKPEYPVIIEYISGAADTGYFRHIRNLVIQQDDSALELIENFRSAGGEEYFSNLVTEIYCGTGARLNHYRLQAENTETARQVNFTQVSQQSHSLVNNFTITLGGRLVRNDLQYRMNEKDCESHMYGLYISTDQQHIDNHTLMDHALPNCFSNEFYKGIMAGSSTGVFNGKIIVRPDAQKTNAYQSNKNILLSDNAHMNAKPQLEIFANDVKCSHGATTGQLDEEALFYLRSRGIGMQQAKAMLTTAFAEDVLDNIANAAVREYVKQLLEAKLTALAKEQ